MTPDVLKKGETAARQVLSMDQPPEVPGNQWQAMRASSYKALGWAAIMRGDIGPAEQAFVESLKLDPNDAAISYEMVRVLMPGPGQVREPEILFYWARAVVYDGSGALPANQREALARGLEWNYTSFHGKDPDGLEKLKALAKTQTLPPPGFTISSLPSTQLVMRPRKAPRQD